MSLQNNMNKLLILGSLLCSVLFTACDDFLTVYPTTQITEEEFWQDKNDFNNARAGAYMQLVSASVTNKILYWGEVRSDNVRLNQMSNTSVLYMQQAILRHQTMINMSGLTSIKVSTIAIRL